MFKKITSFFYGFYKFFVHLALNGNEIVHLKIPLSYPCRAFSSSSSDSPTLIMSFFFFSFFFNTSFVTLILLFLRTKFVIVVAHVIIVIVAHVVNLSLLLMLFHVIHQFVDLLKI